MNARVAPGPGADPATLRGDYAIRIAQADALADAAKEDEKRLLAASVDSAGAMLKTVDAFIESLKPGETGGKSPLRNAARFLASAARVQNMLVINIDLHLDVITLVKDQLITGERSAVPVPTSCGTGHTRRTAPCCRPTRCAASHH